VDEAHKETASRLGAGNSSETISFLNPDRAARMGSHFLCFGKTPIFQAVDVRLATPPVKLDRRWAKLATAWMDWAITDIAAHEKNFKERETIRAHDQYGECLMKLGRKGDAITQWQKILDTFPTSKEFPRISKKVEAALGVK